MSLSRLKACDFDRAIFSDSPKAYDVQAEIDGQALPIYIINTGIFYLSIPCVCARASRRSIRQGIALIYISAPTSIHCNYRIEG